MGLNIDKNELHLLLEKKRDLIGRKVRGDAWASVASLFLSTVCGTFDDLWFVPGGVIKWFFLAVCAAFLLKLLVDSRSEEARYSFEDLLQDINKLNKISSEHSLVIIKDTFKEHPNRYLVYRDTRWGCRLFPNYKKNDNNEDFVMGRLSGDLDIDPALISLKRISTVTHEKLSVPDGIRKAYIHTFYSCEIADMPAAMRKSSFCRNGRDYYWMTMDEMKEDPEIQEKNKEVLNSVDSLV